MDFQAQKDHWVADRADNIVCHLLNPNSTREQLVKGSYAGDFGSALPVSIWDEFTAWAQSNLTGGSWLRDIAAGKGERWFDQFAIEHAETESLTLCPEDFAPEVFA
jgi:hypothetical protein